MPIGGICILNVYVEKGETTDDGGRTRMLSGLKDESVVSSLKLEFLYWKRRFEHFLFFIHVPSHSTQGWMCGEREQGKVNLSTNCIRTSRGVSGSFSISSIGAEWFKWGEVGDCRLARFIFRVCGTCTLLARSPRTETQHVARVVWNLQESAFDHILSGGQETGTSINSKTGHSRCGSGLLTEIY